MMIGVHYGYLVMNSDVLLCCRARFGRDNVVVSDIIKPAPFVYEEGEFRLLYHCVWLVLATEEPV